MPFSVLMGCVPASSGTQAVYQSVETVVASRRAAPLDELRVRQTGAGVLRASFDGKSAVYLGLDRVDPVEYVMDFKSEDRRLLQLYNGQLRGSVGWPHDVLAVKALGADPFFDGFKDLHPAKTFFWTLDVPGVGSGLIAESRYQPTGTITVETLYGQWQLRQIEEVWVVDDLNFRRINRYWIDDEGIVVRSIQQTVPMLPEMDLTLHSYGVALQ